MMIMMLVIIVMLLPVTMGKMIIGVDDAMFMCDLLRCLCVDLLYSLSEVITTLIPNDSFLVTR